jgi:hypothetical protein
MSSGHLATIPCRDAPVNGLTGGGEGNGAKQAAFTGIVKLQQGGIQLRTVSLTAFYSGQSGFSTGGEWSAEQLTRAEARERVLIMSKDGQTRATAETGRPSMSSLTTSV